MTDQKTDSTLTRGMTTTTTQDAAPTQTPEEIVKSAIARSIESGIFEILKPSPELAAALHAVANRVEFGTDFYGPGGGTPEWLVILCDTDAPW